MYFFNYILRLVFFSAVFSSNAYAYIDGGTALLLLQGGFAAIGAVLVFLKKPGLLIAKIFSRKKAP